jgi:hypothetical protein
VPLKPINPDATLLRAHLIPVKIPSEEAESENSGELALSEEFCRTVRKQIVVDRELQKNFQNIVKQPTKNT